MSTTQGITSPTLAGLFDSPGIHSTPDNGPRLVQKQVVRVKGKLTEAVVMLYLKLAVPRDHHTQTVSLFPDEGISLKASQVYPLSLAKGGRTVIPPNANPSLLKASEILAINRATTGSSSYTEEANGASNEQTSRSMKKAKITISNFQVSLVVPPDPDPPSLQKDDGRLHFVAIVQMTVPFSFSPPKWPYVVRIPLPRCLNNYLNFSVDEGTGQDNTIVEVDPPLLPKPPLLSSGKFRRNSEPEQEVDSADVDDDQNLAGMFYSCSSLSIRWANDDAGENVQNSMVTSKGQHPVRADLLRTSIVYSKVEIINTTIAEVDLKIDLSLEGGYYPGLDSTANLNLYLEGPSTSHWVQDTVSVTPSKSCISTLQSFSLSRSTGSSTHSIKSSSSSRLSEDELFSNLAQQSPDDSSHGISDLDTTIDEEDNLHNVRPPRGIASPDLDFSFEGDDDDLNADTVKPSRSKQRRHSLGMRPLDVRTSNTDTLTSDASQSAGKVIYLVLNVISLCQGNGAFRCSLKGTVRMPIEKNEEDGIVLTIPLIKPLAICLESKGSVIGMDNDVVYQGSSVQVVNRDGNASHRISLSANASRAELDEGAIKVRVKPHNIDESEVGNVSNATTTMPQEFEPKPYPSDESLSIFSKTGFQEEIETSQDSQVDLLSGIIQQASADIHLTTTMEEDMLLEKRLLKKVKTTHAIRATWPSTPAPASATTCGNLLPHLVFAIPCNDEAEIQILYASLNGLSVQTSCTENNEDERSNQSRIIDLQLPNLLKETAKVDVYLLYTIESASLRPVCVFPPVASSIAELNIMINHSSINSSTPLINFASQPLAVSNRRDVTLGTIAAKAYMVPSMSNVTVSFTKESKSQIPIISAPGGPLRKASLSPKRSWPRPLFKALSLFHIVCTVLLTIALIGTLVNLEPMVGSLSRKVDSLALALDVDFSDGTWKPDAKMPIDTDTYTHLPFQQHNEDREGVLSHDEMKKNSERKQRPSPKEPNGLSTDTTSFAHLLRDLSLGFTRTVSWPLRLLLALIYRTE